MKIQTFSIVVGGNYCDAHCPFCVSKMTGTQDDTEVKWKNFQVASKFAKSCGVTTVLLTGKGEPSFYHGAVDRYLLELEPFEFPFIELQTNGLTLLNNEDWIKCWATHGLTAVSISVVHFSAMSNAEIYTKGNPYPDLGDIRELLHKYLKVFVLSL